MILKQKYVIIMAFAAISSWVVLIVGFGSFNQAHAAIPEHRGILKFGGDRFYNYDYSTEANYKENVDWAMSLLFYNDSSVDKVKSDLSTWLPETGDAAYAYFLDSGGPSDSGEFEWDSDKGKKEYLCTVVGDNLHYRIYGPPLTDRFYNLAWGFYNIASTHIDHNECNKFDKWSGESEVAEQQIAKYARIAFGRRHVAYDAVNFHNPEVHRTEGTHHWEGDGFATKIWVR